MVSSCVGASSPKRSIAASQISWTVRRPFISPIT